MNVVVCGVGKTSVERKFAFFGRPYMGGINSVFHMLKAGLAPAGIQLSRVGIAIEGKPVHGDPEGVYISPDGLSEREISARLFRTIVDGGFDGVFINVMVDRVTANMARFLPDDMMKLMIVHGISSGTYVWSRAVRDHVHHTIAISPRISEDLAGRHGFDPARVSTIPHAVDAPFHATGRVDGAGGPLRVIHAGRLADHDKGCLWIPDILAAAGGRPFSLTIAGEGRARAELEARLARAPFPVQFTGRVSQAEMAELYRRHDVALVPSRNEGFGLVIIEAMACGCVPLASRIRGVTDAIVTDGVDGALFPIGDVTAAGAALRRLADDRTLLARLSAAALETVESRFSMALCSAAYTGLIDRLASALPPTAPAEDMARWRMAPGLEPRWRSRLPEPVKVWLRTARERLR